MLHTSWRTVDKSQRRKGWRSCPATIASAVAPGLPFMLLIIIVDVWVSICLGTAAWLRPIRPHAIKQHLDIGIDRHPNTHTQIERVRETGTATETSGSFETSPGQIVKRCTGEYFAKLHYLTWPPLATYPSIHAHLPLFRILVHSSFDCTLLSSFHLYKYFCT